MQRFMNQGDMIVDDMLKGYAKAHKDQIHISSENNHVVVKNNLKKGSLFFSACNYFSSSIFRSG